GFFTFIDHIYIFLAGKWVPLCCTLGAVWITIYYRKLKLWKILIIYEELCIKFPKHFIRNLHKHLVKISSIYSDYFLNYNHTKKSILSKTGFAVFPDAFENYWTFFTFDHLKHQLDSLSYQKQISFFKIEALLLLQNVVTDQKKKHIIVKSIHSSLRSEPKTTYYNHCYFNQRFRLLNFGEYKTIQEIKNVRCKLDYHLKICQAKIVFKTTKLQNVLVVAKL
ncbi:Sec23 trunk domain-containing protein, partial [Aphis craccivora]